MTASSTLETAIKAMELLLTLHEQANKPEPYRQVLEPGLSVVETENIRCSINALKAANTALPNAAKRIRAASKTYEDGFSAGYSQGWEEGHREVLEWNV